MKGNAARDKISRTGLTLWLSHRPLTSMDGNHNAHDDIDTASSVA
jgi:hypothetical protein